MINTRSNLILIVFLSEVLAFIFLQNEIIAFANKINDLSVFRGIGTIIFSAPIAFLLWKWRDSDKQRSIQHDADRLKNENDKLILEKKILERDAQIAKDEVDKKELEKKVDHLEKELSRANGFSKSIDVLLEKHDIQDVILFLDDFYESGNIRNGLDNLTPEIIKDLFLTDLGKAKLKIWLEGTLMADTLTQDVFKDGELPIYSKPAMPPQR